MLQKIAKLPPKNTSVAFMNTANHGIDNASSFDFYVNALTNAGLSISILFLCVHLFAFSVVDDLRNLPGKNLASFCAALLLEYSSTLLSAVLTGTACYVNELLAYYFILASAFWMLTMSYDVWQTLRTKEFATASNKTNDAKFLYYSLWSWLAPAALTLLVFLLIPIIWTDFQPDFDTKRCLFVETVYMYIIVESAFAIILLLNTFFFASSVHRIHSTRSAVRNRTRNAAFRSFAHHFSLYGRLSLIMGVTWTAEFVIYYSHFDILSLTFKIINTFEGLFIVLAFTCRKDVLEAIKSFKGLKPAYNGDLIPKN